MPVTLPFQISVVIPVYNAAKFVEAAVASALQFEEVKEVLLVDDAGPDDGLAICEAMALREPRVKLLRHPGGVNKGAAESRNLGILHATQEYIAFLDADDYFLPNRFIEERAVFQEHPDADGVYGAIAPHYYDAEGEARFRRMFGSEITTVHERVAPELLFGGLNGGIPGFGYFHLDALTVKRSAVMGMDRLMRKEIHLHEDTDFILRLAWYARLYPGSIDAPIAMRGVHGDNRISSSEFSARTQFMLYKCLWQWALQAGVDQAITERYHYRYRLYAVGSASSRFGAFRRALRYREYLKKYDYRDELIGRLVGQGTRAASWLHKITSRP